MFSNRIGSSKTGLDVLKQYLDFFQNFFTLHVFFKNFHTCLFILSCTSYYLVIGLLATFISHTLLSTGVAHACVAKLVSILPDYLGNPST